MKTKYQERPPTSSKDITAAMLDLNISPAPHSREGPSSTSNYADQRFVRNPHIHSSETILILWNLEEWLRSTIRAQAIDAEAILSGDGKKLDIIKVLHNVRHLFRDIKKRSGQQGLYSGCNFSATYIECMIDQIRCGLNESKHSRKGSAVWGTDLSTIKHASNILRALFFLLDGADSLFRHQYPGPCLGSRNTKSIMCLGCSMRG